LNGVPLHPDHESQAVIGDRLSLAGLEMDFVPQDFERRQNDNPADSISSVNVAEPGPRSSASDAANRIRLMDRLSPAELEVVRRVCRGETTNVQIAAVLLRSPHTIRTQLNSIYKKLNVHSREELVSFVRRCESR
jgi:DNA-binding CsgD family transcriptional regulator